MSTETPVVRRACDRCHKRKQRCLRSSTRNEELSCRRCKEAGEKCVFSPPCRLGRPTNKLKQQKQDQGDGHFVRETEVPSSSHAARASSQLHLLRTQSLEYGSRKSRAEFLHARSPRHNNNRQPERSGRPQRSQPAPSTPPLDSPFSSTSTPNIIDETVLSTTSVTSSAPSLNVFTDYLREITTSLQQVRSTPTQSQTQQAHYTYPTSALQELHFPASDHHLESAQMTKLSSIYGSWNVPQGIPYGVYDGYHVRDMPPHNNDTLLHMPDAYSGISPQTCETISSSQQIHINDQVTLQNNDTSQTMSSFQQFGRESPPHPLTPPQFSPAGHVEYIEHHTSDSMHPDFIYSQVEPYHAGYPWLNEAIEQYHAVYGKLTENALITPATLAQNYHFQL